MNINKLLAKMALNEALSLPKHMKIADKAAAITMNKQTGRTKAQEISDHVFGDSDRIVIDHEPDVQPHPEVEKHLASNGYSIKDYRKGIAVSKKMVGNPQAGIPLQEKEVQTSIAKALDKTGAEDHLKQKFVNDPSRTGAYAGAGLKIVISRKPHDVAAMSTGQHWESCQTLGGPVKNPDGTHFTDHWGDKRVDEDGLHKEHVWSAIGDGAHIAYLVKHPDDIDKHNGPIARLSVNPFTSTNENGEKHTILRPSTKQYGTETGGFHETLLKWSEDNFKTKPGHAVYVREKGVYPEGPKEFFNYGHDESLKSVKDGDHEVLSNNKDGKFLHSVIDQQKYVGFAGMHHAALNNEGFTKEHAQHLIKAMGEVPVSHYNEEFARNIAEVSGRENFKGIEKHVLNYAQHSVDNHTTARHGSIFQSAQTENGLSGLRVANNVLSTSVSDEDVVNRAADIVHQAIRKNDFSTVTNRFADHASQGIHNILSRAGLIHKHQDTADLFVDHMMPHNEDVQSNVEAGKIFSRTHVNDATKAKLAKHILAADPEETPFGNVGIRHATNFAAGKPELRKHIGREHMKIGLQSYMDDGKRNIISMMNEPGFDPSKMTDRGIHD